MSLTNTLFSNKKPINSRFLSILMRGVLQVVLVTTAIQSLTVLAVEKENSKNLTLSEAIMRTFDNNPELQTFQFRLEAQQGAMIQVGLSPKPEVGLTVEDAFGTGPLSGLDGAQTTLSVSWILDHDIKDKRFRVAARNRDLVESEKRIKELDSAAQTARYYLTSLSYQENMVITERAIRLAITTVKEVKNRVNAGKTPPAELYRAEAELAKRKLELVDWKHELESSIRQLAAQWGSTKPDFNLVSGTLTKKNNVVSFHALKSLINNNPNLARYLSVERIKQAELKLAEEERNPSWKFKTGIRRIEKADDYALVAGISIPFGGSNRNQGRIAEVRAKLSQNQSEADALRIRIETSLFIVYQQLEHSFHVGEMLKNEIIPRLEKALTETRKAYELGKYSYLEWRAVQNELLDAQRALLDTSLAAHLNQIEIERLTGAQITSTF